MFDWEVNMEENQNRVKILLSKVEVDSTIVAYNKISKL